MKWDETEIEFLLNNQNEPIEYLMEQLNRSGQSIKTKLWTLNTEYHISDGTVFKKRFDAMRYIAEHPELTYTITGNPPKKCTICGEVKTDFKPHSRVCTDCVNAPTRVCTMCGEEKPITEFHKLNDSCRTRVCKTCRGKQHLKWFKSYNTKGVNHKKPWTTREVAYLCDNMDRPIKELSYFLGRSVGAIIRKKMDVKEKYML